MATLSNIRKKAIKVVNPSYAKMIEDINRDSSSKYGQPFWDFRTFLNRYKTKVDHLIQQQHEKAYDVKEHTFIWDIHTPNQIKITDKSFDDLFKKNFTLYKLFLLGVYFKRLGQYDCSIIVSKNDGQLSVITISEIEGLTIPIPNWERGELTRINHIEFGLKEALVRYVEKKYHESVTPIALTIRWDIAGGNL
ncbi:hypothetical protein FACS1894192_08140 [Bacilli bacterium]|nr:hypothetical protein FACS1894192_08140 [Bacilli bacterium]